MVAIVDYGVGNLFSLRSSLQVIGQECVVSGDAEVLRGADSVILPGVGAFGDAAAKLRACGLDAVLKRLAAEGKPLLGICLGMQLLFDVSFEYGRHEGLGLIKGQVVPMSGRLPQGLKIPHIGWNPLIFKRPDCPLFRYISQGDCVYFVHSFFVDGCAESVCAEAEYGLPIPAVVGGGNVFGCQFHPEKSGRTGLDILRAFCQIGVGR